MKNLKLSLLAVPFILVSCGGADETTTADEKTDTIAVVEEMPKEELEEEVRTGYSIGDLATDFSLMNVDDQMVSLADYEDAKGFMVIFTCNHCPYSVAYEDRIIALDKRYKDLGYPVIAISPNDPEKMEEDSFENMKVRAEEKGFTFPYLIDEGQEIYPQYGATKTPHVFVLEKTGEGNRVAYIGAIDDNYEDESAVTVKYAEAAIDALLIGEQPAITETVAVGCSIKK